VDVIGHAQYAIGAFSQAGWPERRSARISIRPSKAIRKDNKGTGRVTISHWLENDIVALLSKRRAIPGSVKGDERAASIPCRKLRAMVDREVIGCPMAGKSGYGATPFRADALRLAAVAAIFGGEHELLLLLIVIAFRPPVIGAGRELQQLLGR
jgi:hypothetical protein